VALVGVVFVGFITISTIGVVPSYENGTVVNLSAWTADNNTSVASVVLPGIKEAATYDAIYEMSAVTSVANATIANGNTAIISDNIHASQIAAADITTTTASQDNEAIAQSMTRTVNTEGAYTIVANTVPRGDVIEEMLSPANVFANSQDITTAINATAITTTASQTIEAIAQNTIQAMNTTARTPTMIINTEGVGDVILPIAGVVIVNSDIANPRARITGGNCCGAWLVATASQMGYQSISASGWTG